ncbi:MAG TPA: hypothetical protein VFG00_04395, partial [Acidothermaceae bacterium]|nr:hypothetical protein [Acidothermaceae bacterium]
IGRTLQAALVQARYGCAGVEMAAQHWPRPARTALLTWLFWISVSRMSTVSPCAGLFDPVGRV